MLYIIIYIIIVVPFIAGSQAITEKTGIAKWIVILYILFWTPALLALLVRDQNTSLLFFFIPISMHLFVKGVNYAWKWITDILNK